MKEKDKKTDLSHISTSSINKNRKILSLHNNEQINDKKIQTTKPKSRKEFEKNL